MFKKNKDYFDRDGQGIYGEDLRPICRMKDNAFNITKEEIQIPANRYTLSPEVETKLAEANKRLTHLRETTVNEKPEFFHNLQRIDIVLINDTPPGWNLFDDPTDDEVIDLMRSIEAVGLIHPIHVMLTESGQYVVICGRFRLQAYINLYEITGLDLYKRIPAYIVKESEVDELYIRNLIFESNIQFRTISKFNMIQVLIENYEVMRRLKNYRNEKNIAMELAQQFEISESTVFNYLKVRKLCDSGLNLLYDGRISLKAALYLTRVSKELQEDILKHYGVDGVNVIFRLKLLVSKNNIDLETLKEKIKIVDNLTPEKTKITLEVHRAMLSSLIELLLVFKREEATEHAGKSTRGKFKDVFKFSCNKEDMSFYLEKGMINKVSLNKLLATSIQEMANI